MRYETLYIVHPRYEGPALEEVVAGVAAAAEAAGLTVEGHQPLGRRTLAYPIRKNHERIQEGHYVAITFKVPVEKGRPDRRGVARFEADLKVRDPIVRHLTVRQEE